MGILPIPYVNYENPSWLVSLAATKITGAFGAATFNGNVQLENATPTQTWQVSTGATAPTYTEAARQFQIKTWQLNSGDFATTTDLVANSSQYNNHAVRLWVHTHGTANPVLSTTFNADGSTTFNGNVTIASQQRLINDAANQSNSNAKLGSIELQTYNLNDAWIGENVYFNGSSFVRRATGFGSQIYFRVGEIVFRSLGTDAAGTFNNAIQFKILSDGTIASGTTIDNAALSLTGANFVVTGAGNLTANGATFNGSVGIGVTPTAQLDMSGGYLRVRGGAGGGAVPTNSKGLELTFDSTTDIGYVFAVSRDGAGAYPLSLGPTANPLYIAAGGSVTVNGSVKLGIKTIATLPSAASSSGERYQVSDSATIANRIAFSNGSAWYYEGTAVAV